MKKRKDKDLDLEEYVDDEYFYSVDNEKEKLSKEEEEYENFFKVDNEPANYTYDVSSTDDESNYSDFINVREYDDSDEESFSDEDDDVQNCKEKNDFMYYLSFFSTWFRRIGIAIAVVLIAVFISQGKMKTLLLYILGLVASFFFGYFFMFLLNKFTEE